MKRYEAEPSETFPMLEKRQSFLEKEMELEGARILLRLKAVKSINQFVGPKSLIRVIEGVDKAKKEAFSTSKGSIKVFNNPASEDRRTTD